MDSVLKGVLEEELGRNLQKQRVFSNELAKYPKGSLVVAKVHGDQYLYRKYRDGNKIVSIYVGPVKSEDAKKAYEDRNKYIKLKQDIKDLEEEEKKLRKAVAIYRVNEYKTKYMHANSSCSYCAISYMMQAFGIDVTDLDIAKDINLPLMFDRNNDQYNSGFMLQSKKWFDLFLNPRGLELVELMLDKKSAIAFLKENQNVMIGLKTSQGKHAVVLIKYKNNRFKFFNPTHEGSGEEDYIVLSEDKLIDLLDDRLSVARIISREKKSISLKDSLMKSISALESYNQDLKAFIERNTNRETYHNNLDLFRPLLLDGLTMMEIANETSLLSLMKQAQKQLLSFIRGFDENLNQNEFLLSIIETIIHWENMIKSALKM